MGRPEQEGEGGEVGIPACRAERLGTSGADKSVCPTAIPWSIVSLIGLPVAGVLALAVLWPKSPPLPKLYSIPTFSLIERSGEGLGLGALKGKIWVADFIFTTCPGPCLMMTQRMAELQRRLGAADDVRLVTFTVDPEHDSPEVLREYAARHGARADRWLFLTGDRAAIYGLAEKGFKVTTTDLGEGATGPEGRYLHSTKMVLIDRDGVVRGYFDGVDPGSVGKVASAVAALRRERGGG